MAKRTRIADASNVAQERSKVDRLGNRRAARSRGRQAAAAARRRQRRIRAVVISATAIVILAVGAYFLYSAITYDEPGEAVEILEATHVEQGTTVTDYNTDPPTSGAHYGSTAPWGVHEEPVPNELQVHNLEHGGIVIQYNDSVAPEVVDELREITNQCDVKLLLAPRPDMDSPIAVTAWGHILTLEQFDGAQIQEFIDAHVDEGPERIPSESRAWEDCQ